MDTLQTTWTDSNKIDKLYEMFLDGVGHYPEICPECGKKSAHIYINRYEDTRHGGVWCWCSECHAYSHGSISVPKWWGNYTGVDQSKLCAANPDEMARQEVSIDDFVNFMLESFGVPENVCKYCIWKNEREPRVVECPECGKNTCTVKYDGACIIISCSNCGHSVVGASFFPPCQHDEVEYAISVNVKELPKDKMMDVAKLLNVHAVDLARALKSDGDVKNSFGFKSARKVAYGLAQRGI